MGLEGKETFENGQIFEFFGEKMGKKEQLLCSKREKSQKKEEFSQFYKTFLFPVTPECWRCSRCTEAKWYWYECSDNEIHQDEWRRAHWYEIDRAHRKRKTKLDVKYQGSVFKIIKIKLMRNHYFSLMKKNEIHVRIFG